MRPCFVHCTLMIEQFHVVVVQAHFYACAACSRCVMVIGIQFVLTTINNYNLFCVNDCDCAVSKHIYQ